MKQFSGKVLFLDRSDINTDEIIPARYLTEISKEALKPYLLEDLELEGFDAQKHIEPAQVVISRANFGCGSSREHAPWAFEVNDMALVIAESFARIFKQNMFNCGMMAVELPKETLDEIFSQFKGKDTHLHADLGKNIFVLTAGSLRKEIPFEISGFDRALVEADGWVGYADKHY